MDPNQNISYSKQALDEKLSIVKTNGEKIQRSIEFAMDKLTVYHNTAARGIVVDKAFFELYAKMEAVLAAYKKYNSRVVYNLEDMIERQSEIESEQSSQQTEEKEKSSVPRRSI